MKKKRIRIKWKNVGRLVLVIIVLIASIKLIKSFRTPFSISFKANSIEYGEEFNKDIITKLTYKGKDIKEEAIIEFIGDKIGKNDLTITYKDKKYTVKFNVTDTKPPIIELKGGNTIVELNGKYIELGYTATDNYDGDLTSKVEIKNNVDTSKVGDYIVQYKVYDSSKNEFSIERKVTVTDKTPLDMSLKDFSLNGYYGDTILKETTEMSDEILKKFVFVGDSIPLYYAEYPSITGHQIWNKNGISPETIKVSNININYGYDGEMLVIDAFKKYKPEYALITLGSNSAGWMSEKYFISEYKDLINQIKEVSPDTKIIIQSIPPVDAKLDIKDSLNNKKINNYNYYLLKMCNELGLPFLNSAESLKDSNGTCMKGLCQSDGIHQTKDGIVKLVSYLKSHYNPQ